MFLPSVNFLQPESTRPARIRASWAHCSSQRRRLRAWAGAGRSAEAEWGDLTTGRLLELSSTRKENDRCTWGKAACQERGCLGQALGLDPASGLTHSGRRCPCARPAAGAGVQAHSTAGLPLSSSLPSGDGLSFPFPAGMSA